jgi:hypothetical protein
VNEISYIWLLLRLRDHAWDQIWEHYTEKQIPPNHPGRKPIHIGQALEAVLSIHNTDAQWHIPTQCDSNCKALHRCNQIKLEIRKAVA